MRGCRAVVVVLAVAGVAGTAHADHRALLIQQARTGAGVPACLSPAPANGVYELPGSWSALPLVNASWPGLPPSARPTPGARVAVVDGCIGVLGRPAMVGMRELRPEGTDAALLGWSDGARCDSGGAVRFRRAPAGGLRVELETYTTCGGGRRAAYPLADLTPVVAVPPADALARLRGSDPLVRAAAVERLASRQAEPPVCRELVTVLAAMATPEEVAISGRLVELARDRCLLPGVHRASAADPLQLSAALAIIRLTDEASLPAALLRLVEQGGGTWAAQLVASALDPAAAGALVPALRRHLVAPAGPAQRRAALGGLGKLVAVADQPAFFLHAARELRRCADRAALLHSYLPHPVLAIGLTALTGPRIAAELGPLVRDRTCPAARAAAAQMLAQRLAAGGSPVASERGNQAAWALLIASLPADRAAPVWMILCDDLRHAQPADRSYAPALRGFLRQRRCR